jgi:hypothetical protein
MYFAHIAFEIYDNLKSFQTAMSFQAGSSLSLADFFDFFRHHKKKHAIYMLPINYLLVNEK